MRMNKVSIKLWLAERPKLKQWLWFIVLWVGGLVAITLLTYPLRYLIYFSKS